MSGQLEGRIAIVTGASRGIGAEIARLFAAEGAAVAVTARTIEEGSGAFEGSITTTAEEIVAAGGTAMAIAADLSRPEDRARLVVEAEAALGPADILVNNGAITWFEPVASFSEKRWRLMFEVQVRAPFELAQLVLPHMVAQGRGSILNISSKAAVHPALGAGGRPDGASTGGTVYGMVKAALERFSTGLAAELQGSGVTCNALSPTSIVATPGVVHHRLITPERKAWVEPTDVMARAALALVGGELNGRVAYSQQLLAELGQVDPPADWLLVDPHPRHRSGP
jgi:citronellol/citronellal dehydrogenase